jgi:putative acetyltransferase
MLKGSANLRVLTYFLRRSRDLRSGPISCHAPFSTYRPLTRTERTFFPDSDSRETLGQWPNEGSMLTVVEPTKGQELDDVRELMRAFVGWHRERHVEDIALIDRYFEEAEFEAELAGLPGKYAPPDGQLLIAYLDDRPAGCVALRDLGEGTCEMKRMFVPLQFRGQGVGRALAEAIVAAAEAAGYHRMRLDTSHRQAEAMGLYEAAGFHRIPPYYDLPDDLRAWLVFFERDLKPQVREGSAGSGLGSD